MSGDTYLDTLRDEDRAHPGLRVWGYTQTVATLRKVAVGMPHLGDSKKREVVDWLMKYNPDALARTREEA